MVILSIFHYEENWKEYSVFLKSRVDVVFQKENSCI